MTKFILIFITLPLNIKPVPNYCSTTDIILICRRPTSILAGHRHWDQLYWLPSTYQGLVPAELFTFWVVPGPVWRSSCTFGTFTQDVGCIMLTAGFTALLQRATEDGAKISSRFQRAVMHLCIYCTQPFEAVQCLCVRSCYTCPRQCFPSVSTQTRWSPRVIQYTEKHHFFILTFPAHCWLHACVGSVCSSKFWFVSINNKAFQSLVQLEQSPPGKRLRQAERWTTWCSNRQR